jgi:polyphenol oxidase
MIRSPIALLRPHQTLCDVAFFDRRDHASSDADIARLAGTAKLVGLKQEHGNRAVRVHDASSRDISADALATDVPGLTLSIRFADCQSAVLVAPKQRVVCLVHAGWRGVRSKILTSAYVLLKDEWGIIPQETLVGLGPSLCTGCSDFTHPDTEAPELKQFIRGRCIDLRAALDAELAALGVLPKNIERMKDCTRCHPETYFTYRGGDRDKVQAGFVNGFAITLL